VPEKSGETREGEMSPLATSVKYPVEKVRQIPTVDEDTGQKCRTRRENSSLEIKNHAKTIAKQLIVYKRINKLVGQ
jgi:hypothetical protein